MPSMTVSIEWSRLKPSFRVVVCPHCRSLLELHQPDSEQPDRLLGTCEGCKAWCLIDRERGMMALLPVELTILCSA